MAKPRIIAVVGLVGSGKTEATERFTTRGFFRVGFNDRVYEEVARRGLARTEKDERMVREDMRKKFGMGVMAERSLSFVEGALQEGKNVVVESLYSWSEYKVMKEKFGEQFRVLAIFAPPEIRYTRLSQRSARPHSHEEARSRDYAEIENVEKAGPIAMADWTVQNLSSKEDLIRSVDSLVSQILS